MNASLQKSDLQDLSVPELRMYIAYLKALRMPGLSAQIRAAVIGEILNVYIGAMVLL